MKTIVTQSRIAIIGLGQLGSSIAMRLKEVGTKGIYGIARSEASLEKAMELGIIDYGSTDPYEVLPVVDIAFICIPLTPTLAFVEEHLDSFRPGSLVTDVGSVKGTIVDKLRPALMEKGVYFIGSHPMAGSEKSGMEHATPDLYKDRICFITPTADDDHDAMDILYRFWREIGCRVIELEAHRHDQACAFSSHMLHMAASAGVESILLRGDSEANELACAGGFRDFSRIAASSVEMWVEICKHNRFATLNAITEFESSLSSIKECISNENWDELSSLLTSSKDARDRWYEDVYSSKVFQQEDPVIDEEPLITEDPDAKMTGGCSNAGT